MDSEAAAARDVESWNIPDDAFMEVRLRLPRSSRRRLRLVCRHWRKDIDDRTPELFKNRAVPLAFVINAYKSSAHLVGAGGRLGEAVWTVNAKRRPDEKRWTLWGYDNGAYYYFDTVMVGTCNGLLCLCNNTKLGGAITLANPATGETLAVPRLPGSKLWDKKLTRRWSETYSFAHHPTTRRYKVVHVPCYFDRTGQFDKVQVFTLGDAASWRDVQVPDGARCCCLKFGIVSVDGATYWVNRDTERVVLLDLHDERVASTVALPAASRPGNCDRYLAEVRGRLGVVDVGSPAMIQVWVLGDDGAWSRRYSVQVHKVPQVLARPHFAHGQHVLTCTSKGNVTVYEHKLQSDPGRVQCSEVRISEQRMGVALANMKSYRVQIFNYVEATEPLSVYKL